MRLGDVDTERIRSLLAGSRPCVALIPVGSVEPHGPHLPLGTDTVISSAAAERAVRGLEDRGLATLIAPPIAYGVTRFADRAPNPLGHPVGRGRAGELHLAASSFLRSQRAGRWRTD